MHELSTFFYLFIFEQTLSKVYYLSGAELSTVCKRCRAGWHLPKKGWLRDRRSKVTWDALGSGIGWPIPGDPLSAALPWIVCVLFWWPSVDRYSTHIFLAKVLENCSLLIFPQKWYLRPSLHQKQKNKGGEYEQSTLYACVEMSWWNPLLCTI
jgi:hypothetical protein